MINKDVSSVASMADVLFPEKDQLFKYQYHANPYI